MRSGNASNHVVRDVSRSSSEEVSRLQAKLNFGKQAEALAIIRKGLGDLMSRT